MSKSLQRRQFLRLALLSGMVAACRPIRGNRNDENTPPASLPFNASATLALDLRFAPERDAVEYGPSPAGCDRTVIRGSVRDVNGEGAAGLLVHVWAEDQSWETFLPTDAEGAYETAVSQGLSGQTFLIQLIDGAGTTLLSDVVAAPAIPHCDLNMMTVNLVAVR